MREWLGLDRVRSLLEAELDLALARRRDQGFARDFAGWCPRPGRSPEEYLHREITAGGGTALVGIRFKGGDVEQPFVDLVARDFAHDDVACFAAQLEASAQAFADFAPLWLRIHEGAHQYDALRDAEIASELRRASASQALSRAAPSEVDQRYVAAPLDALAERALGTRATNEASGCTLGEAFESLLPGGSDAEHGLRLGAEHPGEVYAEYEQAFDGLVDEMPELAPELSKSSRDELEDCVRQGALLTLRDRDRFAGLIAATMGEAHALSGYYVVEEIVAREYRGQGLGRTLQSALFEALAEALAARATSAQRELVFGTIHAKNAASLKTALAVGREEVSRYRMFALR